MNHRVKKTLLSDISTVAGFNTVKSFLPSLGVEEGLEWDLRHISTIHGVFGHKQLSVLLVRSHICCHLTALNEHFNSYFTDALDWIRDPFVGHSLVRCLNAKTEEKLLELSCDGTQRIRF